MHHGTNVDLVGDDDQTTFQEPSWRSYGDFVSRSK